MQKKKIILAAVITATSVGIAVYFFRKRKGKRLTNVYTPVYTPPKGVANWEYTL